MSYTNPMVQYNHLCIYVVSEVPIVSGVVFQIDWGSIHVPHADQPGLSTLPHARIPS